MCGHFLVWLTKFFIIVVNSSIEYSILKINKLKKNLTLFITNYKFKRRNINFKTTRPKMLKSLYICKKIITLNSSLISKSQNGVFNDVFSVTCTF
jgi:hypothetical protein